MNSKDDTSVPSGQPGSGDIGSPVALAPVLDLLQRVLADRLIGICLFGSAVIGGLRPHSDVDILIALDASLKDQKRRTLVTELAKLSGHPASQSHLRPLEVTAVVLSDVVPWRYPPRKDFVYGEWLREAFNAGWIPQPVVDPDLAILLHTARQHSMALVGPPADELFDPVPHADIRRAIADSLPALIRELPGDERNVVLTLARMWVTLATDEVVSKDAAATWVASKLPAHMRATVALARAAYLGECIDDWTDRTEEVAAFVQHASTAIGNLAVADE